MHVCQDEIAAVGVMITTVPHAVRMVWWRLRGWLKWSK